MSGYKIDRRNFLKMLGWGGAGTALAGCDLPTTVTLEEGKEEVVSYLMPEEYVIPGVGVWYASTCTQCSATCGIHGRVREGRVLKLEGNPESPVNGGKSCMMGQAALQAHFNPDRLSEPMMRRNGSLQPVSWADALAALEQRIGAGGSVPASRVAWFTGQVSGHQAVLVDEHLDAMGGGKHYVHETVNNAVSQAVYRDMFGDPSPQLRMDKAQVVLSFGADFLGASPSPVHFAGEYAKFRTGKRGVLIQAEPKMSLTGSNADLWLALKPGTEGVLALGIANVLLEREWNKVDVPADVRQTIGRYDLTTVAEQTGVAGDRVQRVAALLKSRSPSLVLAGATVEGQENGYDAVAAVNLLNILLGNVGQTILPGRQFPEQRLRARNGNTKDLLDFAEAAAAKQYDVVFFYNANPVYTAPAALGLKDALKNVAFKVAITQFPDETAMEADLVLPLASPLEDWGTHVAAYQPEAVSLSFQQPLMEPLHANARGFGDVMLSLLKMRDKARYGEFPDYYAYLKTAIANMPGAMTGGQNADQSWNTLLQKGVLVTQAQQNSLKPSALVPDLSTSRPEEGYPMHLIATARMGMWDGRHANLPWLQEAPDQISKVVWDSWAEMHPKTAAKLGVRSGDFVTIASDHGSVETQVYVFNGIHPDAIALPMGQGHEHYGRYAAGRGVTPMSIINPVREKKTGELAAQATRVKVAKADRPRNTFVKMGGSETQAGRKLVVTVSADVLRRTEGGA